MAKAQWQVFDSSKDETHCSSPERPSSPRSHGVVGGRQEAWTNCESYPAPTGLDVPVPTVVNQGATTHPGSTRASESTGIWDATDGFSYTAHIQINRSPCTPSHPLGFWQTSRSTTLHLRRGEKNGKTPTLPAERFTMNDVPSKPRHGELRRWAWHRSSSSVRGIVPSSSPCTTPCQIHPYHLPPRLHTRCLAPATFTGARTNSAGFV